MLKPKCHLQPFLGTGQLRLQPNSIRCSILSATCGTCTKIALQSTNWFRSKQSVPHLNAQSLAFANIMGQEILHKVYMASIYSSIHRETLL